MLETMSFIFKPKLIRFSECNAIAFCKNSSLIWQWRLLHNILDVCLSWTINSQCTHKVAWNLLWWEFDCSSVGNWDYTVQRFTLSNNWIIYFNTGKAIWSPITFEGTYQMMVKGNGRKNKKKIILIC